MANRILVSLCLSARHVVPVTPPRAFFGALTLKSIRVVIPAAGFNVLDRPAGCADSVWVQALWATRHCFCFRSGLAGVALGALPL